MFRGTSYAVVEIIWWLLVALVIGFLIGWWLRRRFLRIESRRNVETRLASERGQMSRLETQARQRAEEADALKARAEEAEKRVAQLESELASTSGALEIATARIADLETGAASTEVAQASPVPADATAGGGEDVATLEARIDALGADVEGLKEQVATRNERIRNLEATIGRLEEEKHALESQLAAKDEALRDLEGRVVSGSHESERVRELEARLAAVEGPSGGDDGPVRPSERAPTESVAASAGAPPSLNAARAAVADIAERTRAGTFATDDNLKKIRGIGAASERALKQLGITSYRQIAHLRSEDIAVVAAALEADPDRIERDNWVAAAAREHEKKYGEKV